MNVSELLAWHDEMTKDAYDLMQRKNHDYAGENGETPFANFETSAGMDICATEIGIMVRMLDKVRRICTYLKAGRFKVSDESFRDTVLDLINYLVILSAYLETHPMQPQTQREG